MEIFLWKHSGVESFYLPLGKGKTISFKFQFKSLFFCLSSLHASGIVKMLDMTRGGFRIEEEVTVWADWKRKKIPMVGR
jgi:hypothetical protein